MAGTDWVGAHAAPTVAPRAGGEKRNRDQRNCFSRLALGALGLFWICALLLLAS